MDRPAPSLVIAEDGARGYIEANPEPTGDADTRVLIRFENGRQALLPREALRLQNDGSYALSCALADLEQAHNRSDVATETVLTLPVMVEELLVGKRKVETGAARVTKTIHERQEVVDEPLMQEIVAIERVPINRVLEGDPPPIRYEGDTMVIPLLEEVMVVEKRVMIKEELHISRRQSTVRKPQTVTLRSEEVDVRRVESAPQADNTVEGSRMQSPLNEG